MTVADSPARPAEGEGAADGPKPILDGTRALPQQIGVYVFVMVPLLALVAAIPLAVVWGLIGWADVAIALVFYVVSGLGITVGYHRYFTHGSFKANRPLRIALAVAGSLAMQGPVIDWVADHRRHHAFSDKQGDPHSPWLHGTGPVGLAKGFWHSHMGWLFDRDQTNEERFTPDLLADPDIRRVDALFGLWSVLTLLVPAGLGALFTWSWQGALTALFWAGLVRVALLHHVTWSINSICHMWGERPFAARDRSANVWWLAIASFGESWHNLHHADPTCARHGVKRGQVDLSAMVIRGFEKAGWATAVRWPTERRLQRIARES
ncbi:MAG: fatty acid desaturase [Pseudonocardia sp.]|uniref:acyl-CoA desaturase n=1 Tax=unclassified Pseudonocardia TaxID=2619320 RepID=UPI00086E9365|nr:MULTISPECIES: fatty acid desaturase [unclassified Pseudonocardia]MBN9111005.1 fatty acid desaturase [Pseudonocardia sp.]ODU26131.1 MAG: stearoyl-CoA 9-desaturase [Pseudonocardia sp. SCN 72-51]ODV05047.1 MAG: stearoyl-CoA 9-desaturase [Pseudonocardia sp. SCN 73-27]